MKNLIYALHLFGLIGFGLSQTACSPALATPLYQKSSPGPSPDDSAGLALASMQVAGASGIVDLVGQNLGGGSSFSPADLIDIGDRRLRVRWLLNKRADLTCTTNEICFSIENEPFCGNDQTGDFHLADGTTGNFVSGAYTLPDGRTGNLQTGPYPTLSSGGGDQPASSTPQASNTDAAATSVVGATTDMASAATQTPTSTGTAAASSAAPSAVVTSGSPASLVSQTTSALPASASTNRGAPALLQDLNARVVVMVAALGLGALV